MVTLGFFSITTSGFLAAYALALGANNFQIGVLASIPLVSLDSTQKRQKALHKILSVFL